MTPPRSSDQSEGFRAKNRPSLTTYASIVRPAAELFMDSPYGQTCAMAVAPRAQRAVTDLWTMFGSPGVASAQQLLPPGTAQVPGQTGGDDPLLKPRVDCRPDHGGPGEAGRH